MSSLFKIDDAVEKTTFYYYSYSGAGEWSASLTPDPTPQYYRFKVVKEGSDYYLRGQYIDSSGIPSAWIKPCFSSGTEQPITGGKCWDGSYNGYKVVASGVLFFQSSGAFTATIPWAY